MRTLYLLLLLLAAVLAAVTVLNWEAFVAPTELSLGFASVSLPLGLTLLSLLVLLTVLFLVHAVYLQGTVLLDTRRHSKELQANRELADLVAKGCLVQIGDGRSTGYEIPSDSAHDLDKAN